MINCCRIGCLHLHRGPNLSQGVLVEEVLFPTQIHTTNNSETGAENRMAHSLFSDQRSRDLWECTSQINFSTSFRWRHRFCRRVEVKRTELSKEKEDYSWDTCEEGCGLYTELRWHPSSERLCMDFPSCHGHCQLSWRSWACHLAC